MKGKIELLISDEGAVCKVDVQQPTRTELTHIVAGLCHALNFDSDDMLMLAVDFNYSEKPVPMREKGVKITEEHPEGLTVEKFKEMMEVD